MPKLKKALEFHHISSSAVYCSEACGKFLRVFVLNSFLGPKACQ